MSFFNKNSFDLRVETVLKSLFNQLYLLQMLSDFLLESSESIVTQNLAFDFLTLTYLVLIFIQIIEAYKNIYN